MDVKCIICEVKFDFVFKFRFEVVGFVGFFIFYNFLFRGVKLSEFFVFIR